MLVQAKMAGREAREAMEKEQKSKEKKLATEALEMEAAKKRKADSDAKKNWDSAMKDLEFELRSIQKYIDTRTKFIEAQMSKQAKSVDPYKIKDYATSIRLASEDKNKMAIQEREVQEKLRVHMGKKHRGIVN